MAHLVLSGRPVSIQTLTQSSKHFQGSHAPNDQWLDWISNGARICQNYKRDRIEQSHLSCLVMETSSRLAFCWPSILKNVLPDSRTLRQTDSLRLTLDSVRFPKHNWVLFWTGLLLIETRRGDSTQGNRTVRLPTARLYSGCINLLGQGWITLGEQPYRKHSWS